MAQNRTVHSRTKKTDDIEIHVCTVDTDHGSFTDVREYVVSLDQYGRGLTFPAGVTEEVLNGLESAWRATVRSGTVAS